MEERLVKRVYWMNPDPIGPENAHLLEIMLHKKNTPVSVTHFESPEALNRELARQLPHLVITNIGADFGGLSNLIRRLKTGETLDAIKADEELRKPGPRAMAGAREWNVPVYVASGHDDLFKRRDATEADLKQRGAAGVFAMPTQLTQMVDAVKRHLDAVK